MKNRMLAAGLSLSVTASLMSTACLEVQAAPKKDETVYVICDADGKVKEQIVSNHLTNTDQAGSLKDASGLTDIENVKGDESYTKNADGTITWAADGGDIYYQGKSTRELPVEVAISYQLDGRKVSAKELDGASGHLVMTLSYKNHTAKDMAVGEKTCTMYQPFLCLTGILFDGTKAENVTVSKGKVLSTGEQTVVVGMAMPGLEASLGLDTLKDMDDQPVELDLPGDEVVIEADIKDFSLLTILTMADNSLMAELDTEELDTVDDLKEKMNDLQEATDKLIDGCKDLDEGVGKLADGTGDLVDGVKKLRDGAQELDEGAGTLKEGTKTLYDGTKALSAGAKTLSDGAGDLNDGLKTYISGVTQLYEGAAQLAGLKDLGQVSSGISQLSAALNTGDGKGTPALKSATAQVSGGAAQLLESAKKLEDSADAQNLNDLVGAIKGSADVTKKAADGAKSASDALGQLSGVAGGAATGIDSAVKGINAVVEADNSKINTVVEDVNEEVDAANTDLSGKVSAVNADIDKANQAIKNEKQAAIDAIDAAIAVAVDADQAQKLEAAKKTLEGINTVDSISAPAAVDKVDASDLTLTAITGVDTKPLSEAADALKSGAAGLGDSSDGAAGKLSAAATGLNQYATGIGSAASGVSDTPIKDLVNALTQLSAGAKGIDSGVQQLAAGAKTLEDSTASFAAAGAGMKQLNAGFDQLVGKKLSDGSYANNARLLGGAGELAKGAKTIAQGAAGLDGGAGQLSDGTIKLKDGTSILFDGVKELYEGTQTLDEGVGELKDGTTELVDGVQEYSDDGITKLVDLVNDDLVGFCDRLEVLQDYAQGYTSYSGLADGMEGKVKFIYKTDGIGE